LDATSARSTGSEAPAVSGALDRPVVQMRRPLVTFLTAKRRRRSDGAREHRAPRHDRCMRLLDVDIDLILLTLTVLVTVGAMEPPTQPPVDVPMICIETVCYPARLVLP